VLTIDDVPSPRLKEKICFLLEHNIKAMLYARGEFIEQNRDQLIFAIQQGFPVGNHSYSHTPFSQLSLEACFEEIDRTEDLINRCYEETGVTRPGLYVRLPFGDRGAGPHGRKATCPQEQDHVAAIQAFLKQRGFQPAPFQKQDGWVDAFWHIDPQDYKRKHHENLEAYLMQLMSCLNASPQKESILLLHDFEKAYNEFAKKLEAPAAKLREPGLSEADVLRYKEEIVKGRKDMSDYVRRWLESNSSTPAAIAAVQVLDIRTDLPQYQKVVKDLSVTFNSTAHFRQLKQKVEFAASGGNVQGQEITDPKSMPQQKVEGVLIAAGKSVPEIALPDPKGNVRKLSDMKGKVVLIDFWASW
jgi:peptidoglycan/xylan/chitin deacetylase (PgdA/CDA1 family)